MTTLRVEPFSGIAGDMFLGMLVDLGADVDAIRSAVKSVIGGNADFTTHRVVKNGIAGTKAVVMVDGAPADEFPQSLERAHHHHMHHDHGVGIGSIRSRVEAATISTAARGRSLALFDRLFRAEARVHGVSAEAVHLHEAGAADALGEVVGSAVALENLDVDRIVHAPVPWPSGSVKIQHGIYPNPAPASAVLLEGRSTYAVEETFEIVTPTGAAMLASWAEEESGTALRVRKVGYGAGTVELARANVLRGSLCDDETADRITVLETHVDDVTPETLGYVIEELLAAGALDAAITPILMKKNRPGHRLTVMARPEDADALSDRILSETGTLGIRRRVESRIVARRTTEVVTVDGREFRVVVSSRGAKPEHDDCRRAAMEWKRPLEDVRRAVLAAWSAGR